MQLLTLKLREKLLANNRLTKAAQAKGDDEPDHVPVVKFFNPCGAATWLITEMLEEEPDILFGLCDLGQGFPELGYVRLSQLQNIRLRGGLGIERDLHFTAKYPLSVYARAARDAEGIVESEETLRRHSGENA